MDGWRREVLLEVKFVDRCPYKAGTVVFHMYIGPWLRRRVSMETVRMKALTQPGKGNNTHSKNNWEKKDSVPTGAGPLKLSENLTIDQKNHRKFLICVRNRPGRTQR